jgi:ribosomal protein S18 acetylase RimI-like enzyme
MSSSPAAALEIRVIRGAPAQSARRWAAVFHEAFGAMLTFWPALPRDRARALWVVAHTVDPACVYLALDADGGVCGVAFAGRRLLRADREALGRVYGRWGAAWRTACLRPAGAGAASGDRRDVELDGFAVAPEHRGAGIGSAMLSRIIAEARRDGAPGVSLVVGETSPARRLYERFGFSAGRRIPVLFFASRVGYARLVRMRLDLTLPKGEPS